MTERWSREVNEHSGALDREHDVFKNDDPCKIASSPRKSFKHSKRREGTPLQSAATMPTFYINRAGHRSSNERKRTLEQAKSELRQAFGQS